MEHLISIPIEPPLPAFCREADHVILIYVDIAIAHTCLDKWPNLPNNNAALRCERVEGPIHKWYACVAFLEGTDHAQQFFGTLATHEWIGKVNDPRHLRQMSRIGEEEQECHYGLHGLSLWLERR